MLYYIKGLLSILNENNISCYEEIVNIITPLGYTKIAEYIISMALEGTVEEIVTQMQNNLLKDYTYNIKLKPFVKEYLNKLKEEGEEI